MVIHLNVIFILGRMEAIWADSWGEVWLFGEPVVVRVAKSWHISVSIAPNVATVFPISSNDDVLDFNEIELIADISNVELQLTERLFL